MCSFVQLDVLTTLLVLLGTSLNVLGLARTGLIFIKSQEGTQRGGLTQPGQTEQGIRYHGLSCWVPMWGSWAGGSESRLGRTWGTRQWELLCAFCCLFCIFSLTVLLLLLFASFAIPSNCPYPDPQVFCLFLSILHPTPVGRGAIERPHGALLPAMAKLQHWST